MLHSIIIIDDNELEFKRWQDRADSEEDGQDRGEQRSRCDGARAIANVIAPSVKLGRTQLSHGYGQEDQVEEELYGCC